MLSGEIPAELFDGVHGAPVDNMFSNTFAGCDRLTGEIPADLFGEIQGAPAKNMFNNTFGGCTGLTGIGGALFAGISGAPAEGMYSNTFDYCTGLTGNIPSGLFGSLSGASADDMFSNTFYNCRKLYGKSARNPDGTYLYDVFPTATSSQVGRMYDGTCLYDNASIPSAWGGAACTYTGPIPADEVTDYSFTITTVPNISSFEFVLNAAGEFIIDWGDGTVEPVSRATTDTQKGVYSHAYASARTHTIKLGGTATGYHYKMTNANGGDKDFNPSMIQFYNPYGATSTCKVASISGSLGKIFPTLTNPPANSDAQPRFSSTFEGCSQLTEIPGKLFDGVSGAPIAQMFAGTFSDTGITQIPDGLFAGLSGQPAEETFSATFAGTSITEIPADLFSGLTGIAKEYSFGYTFAGCTNLTSIPRGLFDGITVDPETGYSSFEGTFSGCTALTGPSAQMSNGTYLYNIANFDDSVGYGMYIGCTGLDDYATMPDYLKEE